MLDFAWLGDPRVPVTHSYRLNHVLKANAVPVKFVIYRQNSHFPEDTLGTRRHMATTRLRRLLRKKNCQSDDANKWGINCAFLSFMELRKRLQNAAVNCEDETSVMINYLVCIIITSF
jgi:hypothetical protein